MTQATSTILLVAIVIYGLLAIAASRRVKEPGVTTLLVFLPFFSLLGGYLYALSKEDNPAVVTSYLEVRMFPIRLDDAFNTTFLLYFAYAVLAAVFLMLTRPLSPERLDQRKSRIKVLSAHFPHAVTLGILAGVLLAQFVLSGSLLESIGGSSLYGATYEMNLSTLGYKALSYLHTATAAVLGIGLVAAITGKARDRRYTWLAVGYLILFALQYRMSIVLGESSVMLTLAIAVLLGLVSFSRPVGAAWGLRGLAITAVAVVGLYLTSAVRAQRSTVQQTLIGQGGGDGFLAAVGNPARVLQEFSSSGEMYASYNSLYGLITTHFYPQGAIPVLDNTYDIYAKWMALPLDQGFVIHPVAAWWVIFGAFAPLFAALYSVALVWFYLWCSRRPIRGGFSSAVVVSALTWAFAALPFDLFRGGPEGLRGTVIGGLILPALCTWPLWRVAWRRSEGELASVDAGRDSQTSLESTPLPGVALVGRLE